MLLRCFAKIGILRQTNLQECPSVFALNKGKSSGYAADSYSIHPCARATNLFPPAVKVICAPGWAELALEKSVEPAIYPRPGTLSPLREGPFQREGPRCQYLSQRWTEKRRKSNRPARHARFYSRGYARLIAKHGILPGLGNP